MRIVFCVLFALASVGSAPALAQQSTDMLKAEGAPVSVARTLEAGIRKALQANGSYKLLGSPIAPAMAQLTLGCTLDSAGCVSRLAKMRKAKIMFHLRVLPFGSRAKAVLRKFDGATGKTLKTVSYRFKRRKAKKALAVILGRMFGGTTAVAKRKAPAPRRVAARPAPRRAAARPAPRKVAARPAPRRVAARPAPRKVAARPAPRRVAARPAPRKVAARPAPRRVAARPAPRKVAARPAPRRPVARRPEPRKIAAAKRPTTPPKTPSVPLYQQPSLWAWVAVGAAVISGGLAVAFGVDAQSKLDQVNQLIKDSATKQVSYNNTVKPIEDEGKGSATLANVFIGVGATAAVTAVVLFLLPKPKPKKTTRLPPRSTPGSYVLHSTP